MYTNNFVTQAIIKLKELALHRRNIGLLERQGSRLIDDEHSSIITKSGHLQPEESTIWAVGVCSVVVHRSILTRQ